MDLSPAAFRDAADVLDSALAGHREAVVDRLDAVVNQAGLGGAYDVAWCLAAAATGPDLARGVWRLEFPGIESATYEAKWVARFISAYANADPSTGAALMHAARADGHLTDCLLTLAGSAAASLRHRA